MGSRGPVPKRSDRRHGHRSSEDVASVDHAPGAAEVDPYQPAETWHPIAAQWYESLGQSGQSSFYEPSDWATAYLIAESMSRDLSPQVVGTTEKGDILRDVIPLKGASLSAYLKAMGCLLVTEGDRRRTQLELMRQTAENPDEVRAAATVTDIRAQLGVA